MPRDNTCMYMVHVCFYICCVAAVVKDSGFFSLGVLKYVFSVCIVTRGGAVGARVWEV